MAEPKSNQFKIPEKSVLHKSYIRFNFSHRIAHLILLVSFTTLGLTGLPQKYASSPLGGILIRIFGGIETIRQIHHFAAIVLALVSIYHILAVLYRIYVLRVSLSMMPVLEDFKHLYQDISYYLGRRIKKAYYGRYNYAEKVEYFAVVWGTIIMGITGFLMWNPIASARLFPGEYIPAAKAAHGGEALLAVLAIIIWHFYHVHLRHFNKSMFTGSLTHQEMEHEHPAELAQIEAGASSLPPSPELLLKRKRIYFPLAATLAATMALGAYFFFSYEETAIATVPRGETVEVFSPITPTPRPTPTTIPTSAPGQGVNPLSWAGSFEELFRNRCSNCHGLTNVGGLSLSSYADALKGGKSGPAILPGDPDASVLIQIQSKGNHPGQLTIDELNQVIDWVKAGAPEK